MSQQDNLDDIERFLGRFDFATKLSALEEENHQRMKSILISFIEVADSFDRLFSGVDEQNESFRETTHDLMKTCRLIQRQLLQSLKDAGVTQFMSSGQPACPDRHEIIGVESNPDYEEDTVVKELFRGYGWDGEVLRKARVIVAQQADRHS